MSELTIGSLFDGSGGFPLAASRHGIKPVWASEIEPECVKITRKRFPEMKHLGDVTKIDGAEIEPVDIITFGSPCNDVSRAGRREGLEGSQSRLFFEAIRIIKEMRVATHGEYPRYAVYENVPGVFASNGGDDFRRVLDEVCQIAQEGVSVPRPEKWSGGAGLILADSFSVGWRVMDAQYWGVPQRRKRVFLVADFGGQSAGEILFKPEVCGWNPCTGQEEGPGASTSPHRCPEQHDKTVSVQFHPTDSRIKFEKEGKVQTLTARMGTGGNNIPLVLMASEHTNAEISDTVAPTLLHAHVQPILAYQDDDKPKIRKLMPVECGRLQGFPDDYALNVGTESPDEEEIEFFKNVWSEFGKTKKDKWIAGWLKKEVQDTQLYHMWGNGVALPCVERVMSGIADYTKQSVNDCG